MTGAFWEKNGLKRPKRARLVQKAERFTDANALWGRLEAFVAGGGDGWLSTTDRVYRLQGAIPAAVKRYPVLAGELVLGGQSLHVGWNEGHWCCTSLTEDESESGAWRVQVVRLLAIDPALAFEKSGADGGSGHVTYHVYWPVTPDVESVTHEPTAARFVGFVPPPQED